jgi:hypothetical protein
MPYDLYGQYYSSARDAENAEMAQCAAIDASIAMRQVEDMKRQQPMQDGEEIYYLRQHIQSLEERLEKLERILLS